MTLPPLNIDAKKLLADRRRVVEIRDRLMDAGMDSETAEARAHYEVYGCEKHKDAQR